jgi:hypothetical protein
VSVAVDSSDNVYVSDWQNYRIQKFTSNGTFITKWGSKGSGDGQFGSSVGGHPNIPGLAVDIVGNVYASDAGNNRIQKFTSNGTFITKWGSVGSGNLELNAPEGLAVDLQGSVYVVDRLNNRIQKYNIIVPENLKITVKDKDGIPVMGATISSTAQPSGQSALSGVTGADGATTFSGVLPGDYSFEVSKDIYNTQNIQVRVTSAQITDISVRLERTLSFTYSDLSVTPAEAKPGDAVAVSVTVKNIGDQSGAYSFELKLDGATKETKTGILNGGASVTVTFTVSGAAEGIHTVAVGALSESFKVKTPLKPAAISVKTLQISKTLAKPGEEIEVTVTLENTGEQSGSYDLVISLDGVEKDSSTVTLEGGKTVAKTVKLSSGFEGVHKVTVDGKSIEFEVKKESSGIDGFAFEAVAIGLMIAVLLLVVYRKSKGEY